LDSNVTLAFSQAFKPTCVESIMQCPPHDAHEPMLTPLLIRCDAFVSVILMASISGLFIWQIGSGMGIEHADAVSKSTGCD